MSKQKLIKIIIREAPYSNGGWVYICFAPDEPLAKNFPYEDEIARSERQFTILSHMMDDFDNLHLTKKERHLIHSIPGWEVERSISLDFFRKLQQ